MKAAYQDSEFTSRWESDTLVIAVNNVDVLTLFARLMRNGSAAVVRQWHMTSQRRYKSFRDCIEREIKRGLTSR